MREPDLDFYNPPVNEFKPKKSAEQFNTKYIYEPVKEPKNIVETFSKPNELVTLHMSLGTSVVIAVALVLCVFLIMYYSHIRTDSLHFIIYKLSKRLGKLKAAS
jgi:hypothetical protein